MRVNEDEHTPARMRRPDGLGNDVSCPPTGTAYLAGSPDVTACSTGTQPGAGFFRFCILGKVAMKHFLNTQDWSRTELDALLTQAALYKQHKLGDALKGKSIALVFFNPSMRTRTSFELGAFQLGGHAVVLQPGKDAWPIEFNLGTVMDGDTEEHIAEVARVLGRYVDLIGVRA